MNPQTKDGGPAFPTNAGHFTNGATPGMTLRDWFAGQALTRVNIVLNDCKSVKGHIIYETVAEASYLVADAMLKAREQRS